MSTPTEGPARQPARGGNAFTRRLGPLPLWAWMALGLGLAVVYSQWRKNKAAAATQAAQASATTTAGQTPPFIIQNYAQVPGAPVTPTTPTPPGTPVPSPPPPGSGTGVPATPPSTTTSTPSAAAPTKYRVKTGDTLSSIAAKYHTTWQNLYNFNTSPASGRPASTIATLKARGPNLLETNELILIPQP